MSAPKLTPWAGGQPPCPGVWEREFPRQPMFALWTGNQWMRAASTVRSANRARELSAIQMTREDGGLRWRGLAEEPKS